MTTVIQEIANKVSIMKRGNPDFADMATDSLYKLARQFLPSGSGFDCGSEIVMEESKPNRIVLRASFHHMNEAGFYDGWTDHKIIVTPSFIGGFDMRVTGRNRDNIKEYISDVFGDALNRAIVAMFNAAEREWNYA